MLIADVSEPSISSIFIGMKMELIEGSETSAISIVTPGNYPKENILHTGHSESLKSRINVLVEQHRVNFKTSTKYTKLTENNIQNTHLPVQGQF